MPTLSRFISCFCFIIAVGLSAAAQPTAPKSAVVPRMRVIVDNDFSGDPDGLFQLAHLLLSPSVDIRGIIGSHLKVGDGFDRSTTQADNAARKAGELIQLLGVKSTIPVLAGSNTALPNDSTPIRNEAVELILREAARTDTKQPLYVLCGAGLTEIASAMLVNPQLASKLTLIWIGGPEYADLALPPPNYSDPEYNLNIDIAAARVIFNRSTIPLWQVPRNAYRQCLVSYAQLLTKVKPMGPVGQYLTTALEELMRRIQPFYNIGETYVLGDSPLVLLTALQSSFEADPASSDYVVKQAPGISPAGGYVYNQRGRSIRVYTRLDTRLLFDDFFAKLELMPRAR
ncbi:Inosine/uridine-preferring nucleoside hydrolase [Fibrella aestuarina BUZ 2]|uniref:Inosine/uridine-preferring nucleoside hydrolase n=1 Tax=Fibrella aestuarina BUZ 2 TaxID=1166018 RepID=I0K673_9BACT|nr:nucleoside hydrolase [Fibrella aestuarina]CCG99626.1 Inosine/uridine-preferring nucleoside hydrolase [Fibrella aestuarina BUZ 2]